MSASIADRLTRLDWAEIEASLDEWGHARTPALLTPSECAELRALYADRARFRSRVDLARYRFGVGEYKYFSEPLPPCVQAIRERAYPPLAAIANRWEAALKTRMRHSADLAGLLTLCARRGQQKPTLCSSPADMRFVEALSGKVVLVTADRRIASVGVFGGSDRDHLRESFDDLARDFAKFLLRLARGEAPRKD